MRNFILQSGEYDCGFACLKMLLSTLHHNEKYLYLTETKKEAYSMLDLKNIALEYGLKLKGVQVESLVELKNSICLLSINGINHYVLVKKITKAKIIFYDPSYGKKILSKSEFENLFTGYSLVPEKVEEHTLTKNTNIVPFWYFFGYVMSLLIDFGFMYLFSYFVKVETNQYLTIISVCGVLINFMFKILISLLASRKIENKYLLKRINDLNEEQIKRIILFKKDYLHFYFSLINYFCVFIFGISILLINGFYSIFFIAFTIICLIFRFMVINKILESKNTLGENIEKTMFNNSKRRELYLKGRKNAENYAFYYYLVPFVYIFIIALSLSITNQIFHYYSFNYYLFYIGFYFTMYECGNNFLKILMNNLEKMKVNKCYILNL
jgi:predicted double-glycine peptidase